MIGVAVAAVVVVAAGKTVSALGPTSVSSSRSEACPDDNPS